MRTFLFFGFIALWPLLAPVDGSALAAQPENSAAASKMLMELFHNLKSTVNDNTGKISNEKIDIKTRACPDFNKRLTEES